MTGRLAAYIYEIEEADRVAVFERLSNGRLDPYAATSLVIHVARNNPLAQQPAKLTVLYACKSV